MYNEPDMPRLRGDTMRTISGNESDGVQALRFQTLAPLIIRRIGDVKGTWAFFFPAKVPVAAVAYVRNDEDWPKGRN